jgi:hypothetical protein
MSDLVFIVLAYWFSGIAFLAAHASIVIPVVVLAWLSLFVPYRKLFAAMSGRTGHEGAAVHELDERRRDESVLAGTAGPRRVA